MGLVISRGARRRPWSRGARFRPELARLEDRTLLTGYAVAVEASTTTAVYGQSVTLTAFVAPFGAPGGLVTFHDGGSTLGSTSLGGR